MAKIQFGAAVADARGKLAGNVFSKSRFGAYLRKKSSPVQPRTPAQTGVRSSFTDFSKAWASTLTDVQRAAWRSLADNNPVTNVFGNQVTLTGLQIYMLVNRNLSTAAVARMDDAPINLSVSSPGAIAITQVAITGNFSIVPAADAGAGEYPVILAAEPINAGRVFVGSRLRVMKILAAAAASPYVLLKTDYEARFGTLSADQKIPLALAYVNGDNGARSSNSTGFLIRT